MSDGSRLGQLLWDEDDPSKLRWGRMFWNQVKKKKCARELENKQKKMRAVGMFLNEGEKENKGKGGGGEIEIGQCVWRRKTRKKDKEKKK